VAGGTGYGVFKATFAKMMFCEKCEEYMKEVASRAFNRTVLAEGARRLDASGPRELARWLNVSSQSDGTNEGSVTLTQCPTCRMGYVNVYMTLHSVWNEPRNDTWTEKKETWTWLAASIEASAEDCAPVAAELKSESPRRSLPTSSLGS
jgi:hypothetical protein